MLMAITNSNSIFSNITSSSSTILTTKVVHHVDADPYDTIPISTKVIISILLSAGVFFGVLGNILVISAILLSKTLRSQIQNLMILSLAVTDLLVSLLPMPVFGAYFVFTWPNWKFGDALCKAIGYIINICGSASVFTLVLIGIDRYFAVVRNKRMMKGRNIKILLCLLWVIPACAYVYPILSGGIAEEQFGQKEYDVCNRMSAKVIFDKSFKNSLILKLVFGVFSMFSLLLMYARIGFHIWKARKTPTDQNRKAKAVKKADSNKTRAVKMMFFIVLTFFIFWVPYWIATFMLVFPIPANRRSINPAFVLITYSLAMLNSSINPVLYALFSKNFRRAYVRVLGSLRGKAGSR